MSSSFDYLAKIAMIGESGVGKTSIIKFLQNSQVSRSYITTIGMEIIQKEVKCSKGVVRMTVWDTAGQERYHSLCKHAYNGILTRSRRHDNVLRCR